MANTKSAIPASAWRRNVDVSALASYKHLRATWDATAKAKDAFAIDAESKLRTSGAILTRADGTEGPLADTETLLFSHMHGFAYAVVNKSDAPAKAMAAKAPGKVIKLK